jgi:hypothetical protein
MPNYSHHDKVPIAGMYDKDSAPIVEIGVIETVPEGQLILDDEPASDREYVRKARIGLTVEEARQISHALKRMADKMEEADE